MNVVHFRMIFSNLQLSLKIKDSNAVLLFLILWFVGLSWCALMYLGCCVLKVVCFLLNENIGRNHRDLDVFPLRNTFNIFGCFVIGKNFGGILFNIFNLSERYRKSFTERKLKSF